MKRFLIFFLIVLLAGTGYLVFKYYYSNANVDKWSFIPSNAGLVFELNLTEDLDNLKNFPIWKLLQRTGDVNRIHESITFLDSINGIEGFSSIFNNTPTLISAHQVSMDEVDYLFVLDLQNISQNTFVNAAIGNLQQHNFRIKTRNYNGFKISEISNGPRIFTYIFFKHYFVASFTPYLVEDAIRTVDEGELPHFQQLSQNSINTILGSTITIHTNGEYLGKLIQSVFDAEIDLPIYQGKYEAIIDSAYLYLSGASTVNDGMIQVHQSEPAPFDIIEVVPSNTAYMYHFSSTDMPDWKDRQMKWIRKERHVSTYQDSLINTYDFQSDQVFDLLDNEMSLLWLEPENSIDIPKLLILEVKDISESLAFFRSATERIALALNDSVYSESYSENEIRFFPMKDFPTTLLGDLGSGFNQCFFVGYRNYLIFSNSLLDLKRMINAIEEEDTWGKSIEFYDFFQKANYSANFSLLVNIPRTWPILSSKVRPRWKASINDNIHHYKRLDLAAFQFSYLDNIYYTNITLSQPKINPVNPPKTNPEKDVAFANHLITKPYLVQTHAHKNYDIFVQDSSLTIYFMDNQQNALWAEDIEGKIQGEVYEIDYYKNGKIQYAFATPEKIHLIDRTGEYLPGYPKGIDASRAIDHFSVIDYDKSRNYRFALTDVDGRVFLTDKDLKLLDGWGPKNLERKSILPLRHARLGRKDVMISIQQNGLIHVMNRRGENMPGFPFDTKESIESEYFLKESNTLGSSSITVVTSEGQLIEVSLEGNVIRRNQLIKEKQETRFYLLIDRLKRSYLIIRKEGNAYDILDDTGNLLFSKEYLSSQKVLSQFYRFGAGKDLIIFIDAINDSLFIYDKSGKLVTGNPLKASNEISLLYSSENRGFEVYSTSGPNMEYYTFNF